MADLGDPAVEALWKNALDHWDEEKAHVAFIEACRESGRLAEAATRYRGMSGDRDRGPEAEKRLKGVLVIAMAQLEVVRTPEPVTKRRTGAITILVLLVAGTVGLMVYLGLAR